MEHRVQPESYGRTDEPVVIETPRPEHVDGMMRLLVDSWAETYPNAEHGVRLDDINSYTTTWLSDEWRRVYQGLLERRPDTVLNRIACDEAGDVVGMVQALRRRSNCNIGMLYVRSDHHGREAGAVLLQEALDWAGPEHEVTLDVAVYNARAIRFYEKHGFRRVEDSEKLIIGLMPAIAMRYEPEAT
jgi:ribosomal protein S18 acetylase RimI-like enzyme